MQKCPVCNASFPITQFVCSYCGHVETERIKKIDEYRVKEISFADSMVVIKENLNALQEVQRPKMAGNLLAILRIIVAIQTFGIALIFWKKPKKRFNRKEFNKLKGIVSRNIKLLRLSAKGSDQLQERVDVAEKELHEIDKEIKRSVLIRQIVTILSIVAYLSLIFFHKGENHSDMSIIPASTIIEGNLSKYIELVIDKYPVKYKLDENKHIKDIRVKAKIKILEKYQFADNENLHLSMELMNREENKLTGFQKIELDGWNTKRLKKAMDKGAKRTVPVTFYFNPKNEIETLPGRLEKFKIKAEIDTLSSN